MSDDTGFLEEAPRVRSVSRLTILILALLTAEVVNTVCWYVIKTVKPDSSVVLALSAVIGALVLNGIVALVKRNGGE